MSLVRLDHILTNSAEKFPISSTALHQLRISRLFTGVRTLWLWRSFSPFVRTSPSVLPEALSRLLQNDVVYPGFCLSRHLRSLSPTPICLYAAIVSLTFKLKFISDGAVWSVGDDYCYVSQGRASVRPGSASVVSSCSFFLNYFFLPFRRCVARDRHLYTDWHIFT